MSPAFPEHARVWLGERAGVVALAFTTLIVAVAFVVLPEHVFAQSDRVQVEPLQLELSQDWRGGRGGRGYYEDETYVRDIFPTETFTFCRIRFNSEGSRGWGRGDWRTDYPDSDTNFPQRLAELTTIKVPRTPDGDYHHVVVDLMDDALFNYPFIYMLEVGNLRFSEEEAARLRSYLLRGGFLMVDDFWGDQEWDNWEYEISRVFDPAKYPMEELDISHPIFHMVFELKEKPQVPSIHYWLGSGGDTSERQYDSRTPHYKGIHNGDRLMVLVCHNTDLGDGWEREKENKGYFDEVSSKWAYPMGINIVVYAMTH